MSDELPIAQVREVNGELVLDDPLGCAVARVLAAVHCRQTLDAQAERVAHFVNRMRELNRDPKDVVIVLINVDARYGKELADALLPGHDWQQYRDRGEVPFARGLADRPTFQAYIDHVEPEAGGRLRETAGAAVVVVDHGTVAVFPVT